MTIEDKIEELRLQTLEKHKDDTQWITIESKTINNDFKLHLKEGETYYIPNQELTDPYHFMMIDKTLYVRKPNTYNTYTPYGELK